MESTLPAGGTVSVVEFGWRRAIIVGAVMLAALLETLDSTIVNVALPTIEGNLGATVEEGIWVITGYIMANVVAIPLNPFLTRMLGRSRYFTICIAGFTAASLLCSTAHGLGPLVAFRVLQGAFGGGLIATSQVVMRETFPPASIGISSALFAIALVLGPAFGPLAGGYLTDNLSWQWIFTVNVVPGTIATIVAALMLRDPIGPRRVAIDWYGVGLLAIGMGSLQFFLDNGERSDWFSDAGITFAAIAAVIALGVFAWWQWAGTPRPVVDLHVLRFRSVSVGSLIGLAFGVLLFVPAIITPLYASSVLGYTSSESGLLLALRALPVVLLTPVFATLAQAGVDVRYMLGSGFALTAASLAWLSTQMTPGTPFAALGIGLFVSGIAQSMLLVPLIVGVLSTTPAELNGSVSPIITLCVQLGGSIATAAAITLFDRRSAYHLDILSSAISAAHLQTLGLPPSAGMLAQIAGTVAQQASTMGFADTIAGVAILAALVVPLVFYFPRPGKAAGI